MTRRRAVLCSVAGLILFTAVATVGPATPGAHAAVPPFDRNNVMSNAVFDAHRTMNAAQIQQFLDRFPKSCLRNHRDALPTGYNTYGAGVSAARIIEASALAWGVNPRVLLATLEKEQSLVTGNVGCEAWRYWSAMGYNCPDGGGRYNYPSKAITGTCVRREVDAGFSAQVNHGAWQLVFNRQRAEGNLDWNGSSSTPNYGYNTAGWRRASAGAPSIYYDGWATIGGTAVFMTNGATASLYTYTPHISANQAFYSLFTLWFGSAMVSAPQGPSAGDLAYVDSTYRTLVGRPATDVERRFWGGILSSGESRATMTQFVTSSMDYWRYQVALDYVLILHRPPDSGGLASWSATVSRTRRNESVLAALAGSTEYFRTRSGNDNAMFVTNLYRDVLGRNADVGGFQYWVNALNAGATTRATAAASILGSREYAGLVVTDTYRRVLGRSPDTAGRAFWTDQYQKDRRVDRIEASLAASGEGFTYLSSLR